LPFYKEKVSLDYMKRTDLDVEIYKEKLQAEMNLLIEELKSVGRVNPDNPNDWEAKPEEMDVIDRKSVV